MNKFEEYLESETLHAKVIKKEDGKFVVQLLDGDESVAVRLGLTEDIDAELTGNVMVSFVSSIHCTVVCCKGCSDL